MLTLLLVLLQTCFERKNQKRYLIENTILANRKHLSISNSISYFVNYLGVDTEVYNVKYLPKSSS